MDEKTRAFLKEAPELTQEERRRINGLFKAFIFRRRKTGEIWTSCCGKHKQITEPTWAEEEILDAFHTPEPEWREYWSRPRNWPECDNRVPCPYCGKEAAVKELGRCGSRKNLWSYHRVAVLKSWQGALWVMAYDAEKYYTGDLQDTYLLTALPRFTLKGVYRFVKGRAEGTKAYWYNEFHSMDIVTQPGRRRWMLSSPFRFSSEYGMSYDAIGEEELERTDFAYCKIPQLVSSGCDLIRLLTLCCFYPRQVEFLYKAGLDQAVRDYTERGIKNAAGIHWDAKDRKDFLGVDRRVLEEIMANGGMETLNVYRAARGQATVEEAETLVKKTDDRVRRTILAKAKKYGIQVGKIVRYIAKQQASDQDKYRSESTVWEEYKDYLIAAEGIGLNLRNPVFSMPKELAEKHDEVTAAYADLIRKERKKDEQERYGKRYQNLVKKYEFALDGLCILAPKGSDEIVLEGKRLCHCVGGYADRHINGKTTILFLRREEKKHTPLVTIEISGNRLIQVHGYDDERTACKDNPKKENPRTLYREFFDNWLGWVSAGSKRDKEGNPILKAKKQREVKTA